MKTALKLSLLTIGLVLSSCMRHARCDNTEVKRILSPDRKLVIIVYDHSCWNDPPSTFAVVEGHWDWFSWSRRPEFCYLLNVGAHLQVDARWLDNKHIEISSPDELDSSYDKELPTHYTCDDIAVTYKFKIKPPTKEEAPDKQTVAMIHEAINRTENCIRQGGPYYADYLRNAVDQGDSRQALELVCTIVIKGKCPISKETYALLETVVKKMGIADTYLEDLKALAR